MENQAQPDVILSVVVRCVGGDNFLQRCLNQLVIQQKTVEEHFGEDAVEIIVPFDQNVPGIAKVQAEFQGVKFIDTGYATQHVQGRRALPHMLLDQRSAAGMSVARGRIIAQVEDYDIPASNWMVQVLEAHRLPYGIIGGAVENSNAGIMNWAVYFQDFGRYGLPLLEGKVSYLSDVNISYKRETLLSIRPVWEQTYNEVTVNWELAKRGETLWLRPQMVVYQERGNLSLLRLLQERFEWGRVFGQKRAQAVSSWHRWLYLLGVPLIPLVLIVRLFWKVFNGKRNRRQFLLCLPAMIVLVTAWVAGEWQGAIKEEHFRLKGRFHSNLHGNS